jgi:hypothetical protein
MSKPMPPTKLEIAKAAVLQAFGLDWDAIAARLARPANRVRLWPIQFPQLWNHYFRIGSNRHMQIAAGEAVQVMRSHIRQSKCEKTQLKLARELRQYYQNVSSRCSGIARAARN